MLARPGKDGRLLVVGNDLTPNGVRRMPPPPSSQEPNGGKSV